MTTTVTTNINALLTELREHVSEDRITEIDELLEQASSAEFVQASSTGFMQRLRSIATKDQLKEAVNQLLSGDQASSAVGPAYTGAPAARSPRVLTPPTTRSGNPPAKRSRRSGGNDSNTDCASGWANDDRMDDEGPLAGMPPLGGGVYNQSYDHAKYGRFGYGNGGTGSGSLGDANSVMASAAVADMLSRAVPGSMQQGVLSCDGNLMTNGLLNGMGGAAGLQSWAQDMAAAARSSGDMPLQRGLSGDLPLQRGTDANGLGSAGFFDLGGVFGKHTFSNAGLSPNLSLSRNRAGVRAQSVSELSLSAIMDIAGGDGGGLTMGDFDGMLGLMRSPALGIKTPLMDGSQGPQVGKVAAGWGVRDVPVASSGPSTTKVA